MNHEKPRANGALHVPARRSGRLPLALYCRHPPLLQPVLAAVAATPSIIELRQQLPPRASPRQTL